MDCGGWSQKHRPNTQYFGERQIGVRTLAPHLAVGKFQLPCISLHICSCHMVSISTTDTLHDWLLCLANLAQGKVTINNYGLNEWNETVMFGNGLQINSSPIFAFSLVSVRWKQKSQMLEFFFKKTVSGFKLFLLLKNWVWIMWIIASVLHQVLTMETWRCSLQIYFLPSFWLVYY